MILSELILNSYNYSKNSNDDKVINKKYDLLANILSKKFIHTYDLKDLNFNTNKHLKKIFLHFYKFQIEEIILYKTLNNDNSICLEFKVIPRYKVKSNNYKRKKNLISTISISKFFRNNYKYIII